MIRAMLELKNDHGGLGMRHEPDVPLVYLDTL